MSRTLGWLALWFVAGCEGSMMVAADAGTRDAAHRDAASSLGDASSVLVDASAVRADAAEAADDAAASDEDAGAVLDVDAAASDEDAAVADDDAGAEELDASAPADDDAGAMRADAAVRDAGPRDSGVRDASARDSGMRDSGPTRDAGAPTDDLPTPVREVRVSSIEMLRQAVAAAMPGDAIIMENGTYTASSTVSIAASGRRGTAERPIVIRAASVGGVTLSGALSFTFSDSENVILHGFVLRHRVRSASGFDVGVLIENSSFVRLSRNDLQLAPNGTTRNMYVFLTGTGGDHRLDHNAFHDKATDGNFIAVNGPTGAVVPRIRIDHNHFARHTERQTNGEAIRLGDSGRQFSSSNSVIEWNLFEQCNGDPEVVSIKSTDTRVLYNTLLDNDGSIVLRHGNHNWVEGNYIRGGRSGIRLYDNDHTIINNVIVDTTGDDQRSALVIGGGDFVDLVAGSNQNKHGRVDRALVAFNTLVGNANSVLWASTEDTDSGSGILAPTDVRFIGNVVVASGVIVGRNAMPSGLTASNNIFFGGGSIAVMTGAMVRDPGLTTTSGVPRPSASSVLADAASSVAGVTLDWDGDPRTGLFDIGADERGTLTMRLPLVASSVGPSSP